MTRAAAVIAVLAATACGPYPEVAQKLDVTTPFANAETWVAAEGTDVRVLVLGMPGGAGGFTVTSMQTPVSAGTSMSALQGEWVEDPAAATATFFAQHEYQLADERGKSILSRIGATRREVDRESRVGFGRTGARLVVTGDAALSGTYRLLQEALGELGAATERDAACAFQIANLAIRAMHLRIIGFGGAGMTQYQSPATYAATLGGSTHVAMEGFLENRTTITFGQIVELNGIRVDGPEITEADSSGNGRMSGTLTFALEPLESGVSRPPITGTLDYGGGGDPADAISIRSGTAVGGHYAMSLDGGGVARVDPSSAPSPSTSECLNLP